MDKSEFEKYSEAGKIAKQIRKLAETLVIKNASLLDVAEKIEGKIIELGGKPAFPVNLSINAVAAHQIPGINDKTVFSEGDLVKIDFGIHVDGYIVDTAFSVSIGRSEENEKLIKAANEALSTAISKFKPGTKLFEIGSAVEKVADSYDLQPIRNLSGHLIERYTLHAGASVPNYDNGDDTIIEKDDIFAVEPFITSGKGMITEGKKSEIYLLVGDGPLRTGREILSYIKTEYKTLPFAKRWLIRKFGAIKANLAIKELLIKNILKEYNQLVEVSGEKVAQAEHTVIAHEKPIVLTN